MRSSVFSEDIDLSVSPVLLGHPEIELDEAPSKSMRQKTVHASADGLCRDGGPIACAVILRWSLRNHLWSSRSNRGDCSATKSIPGDRFTSALVRLRIDAAIGGRLHRSGSKTGVWLTDRPTSSGTAYDHADGRRSPAELDEERDEVVAMEVERTFWEKATILHAGVSTVLSFNPSESDSPGTTPTWQLYGSNPLASRLWRG